MIRISHQRQSKRVQQEAVERSSHYRHSMNTGASANATIEQRHHPRAVGNTHSLALNLVGPGSGKVLDAAAGDGWISRQLEALGYDVTSADIHFDRALRPTNAVELDLNKSLPFGDASFQGAVSIETVEHLENPWYFFRELGRVLKPNGFLVMSTPNIASLFSRVLHLSTGRLLWFQPCDVSPLGHITPIHRHLLWQMARRAGLLQQQHQYSAARFPLINVSFCNGGPLLGESLVTRFTKTA